MRPNLFIRSFLSFFFLILLLFSSCQKRMEQNIDFDVPGEEPLAYLPGVEWAVITDSVAALREDAGFENKVVQHARRGDVFVVTGKRMMNIESSDGMVRTVTWYGFDEGWLIEDSLSVYENRLNAQNAAKKLLKR